MIGHAAHTCWKKKNKKQNQDKLEIYEVDVGMPVPREPVVTFAGSLEGGNRGRSTVMEGT